jgi:hypothetical protein
MEARMKMRVRHNISDLEDKHNLGVDVEMIEMEGKIIDVSQYVSFYKGEGFSWNIEWLEPVDDNEAWFSEWRSK